MIPLLIFTCALAFAFAGDQGFAWIVALLAVVIALLREAEDDGED